MPNCSGSGSLPTRRRAPPRLARPTRPHRCLRAGGGGVAGFVSAGGRTVEPQTPAPARTGPGRDRPGRVDMSNATQTLTTATALDLVAYGRAPRPTQRPDLNCHIQCADGYRLSVQASWMHYANDSAPEGNEFPPSNAPYWRSEDAPVSYPYITFEVGATSSSPEPEDVWEEYDSGGVWAFVPREVVADLIDRHGGAEEWVSA